MGAFRQGICGGEELVFVSRWKVGAWQNATSCSLTTTRRTCHHQHHLNQHSQSMAPKSRGRLAIPTTRPLPDSLLLPSNNSQVFKTLSRLSRSSLLSLASEWCSPENLESCGPYILGEDEEEEDEEAPYEAARSLSAVEGLYSEELPARKGSKREVVDHILEGDWRHGISLRQLAMVESRYILDHPTSTRWTAMRLSRRGELEDTNSPKDRLPRFHGQTFLRNLQREIAPISKAHYYLTRPKSLPVTLLRVYLHESPYNTQKSFQAVSSLHKAGSENGKSVFVIFPHGTPFVYVSVASAGVQLVDTDSRSLQKFAIEAVPKALSRPNERYELRSTHLTARSLTALLAHRGSERTNAVAGGWSIFADDEFSASALDYRKHELVENEEDKENQEGTKVGNKRLFEHANPTSTMESPTRKRQKLVATGRFGKYGLPDDGKGLNRFDVRINDPFTGPVRPQEDAEDSTEVPDQWKPEIRLSFQGTHVFAGVRQLVENGIIDGEKMPGWLTGEGSVSIGVVKDGRLNEIGKGV
jgi:central kinetochore subunit Mis15/CHL4